MSIRQINLSEGRSFGVLGIPIPNATMISYLLVAVQGEGGVGSDRGIVSGVKSPRSKINFVATVQPPFKKKEVQYGPLIMLVHKKRQIASFRYVGPQRGLFINQHSKRFIL